MAGYGVRVADHRLVTPGSSPLNTAYDREYSHQYGQSDESSTCISQDEYTGKQYEEDSVPKHQQRIR